MGTFRIVVAAHGRLADALAESASLISPSDRQITPIGLTEDEGLEQYTNRLRGVFDVDDEPVLVLVDLAGGTPANAARLATSDRRATWIISNANLATLLEAALATPALTDQTVAALAESGAPRVVA